MSFKDVGLRLEPQTLLADVTCVTANDRQDPLFTMSDNTPASQRETRRIRIRYFMDDMFG